MKIESFQRIRSSLENYISSRISLQYIFIIPIMVYGLFLTYIIHISLLAEISNRKINRKSLNIKKKLTVAMCFYFLYQFCFMTNKSSFMAKTGDLFICLLVQLLEIFTSLLTLFIVRLITKKLFHIPFQNYFIYYWGAISLKIFSEFFWEIENDIVLDVLTFSTFGFTCTSCLTYLFYKYPRDDLHSHTSNSEVLYELQQFLPMISEGKYLRPGPRGSKGLLLNSKNKAKGALATEATSTVKKFRSLNYDFDIEKEINNFTINDKKSAASTYKASFNLAHGDISLDEISQNQPEILPLYPKIDIQFKDYFKFYQHGSDGYFNLEEPSITENFFFQIVIKITEMNIHQTIKRNIQDFLNLQHEIKNEFSTYRYMRKICERVPSIKIPKNLQNVDFYKSYKICFEIFLKNVLREPAFITDDVLAFLEIQDERLSFSYNLSRKKVLNVFNASLMGKFKDDTFTNLNKKSSLENNFRSDAFLLPRQSSKNLFVLSGSSFNVASNQSNLSNLSNLNNSNSQNYSNNSNYPITLNKLPTVVLSILEINKDLQTTSSDFSVVIRVSQNYMFKIVNKKLSEVMKMITEISKINKNNENIKNLVKTYNSSDFSKNDINYKKFHQLLGNVLQNAYDNLKIYANNSIINDFFSDFKDESISRCESFIGGRDLTNPNTNPNTNTIASNTTNSFLKPPKPIEKKDIAYFYNLINSGEVVKVSVEILNYMFLTIEFKPHVFYLCKIRLKLQNGEMEELNKKLKFKELNEFANLMSVKLNLPLTSEKKKFKNVDEKIRYRKEKLNKTLNEIFNHERILETRTWGDILERDRKYRDMKSDKHKRDLSRNKPSFIFNHRTESKESYLGLNIRDSVL